MSDELLKLAERCEKAEGLDRELDAQIAAVLRLEKVPHWARNWAGEWRPTEYGSVVLMDADGEPGPHFMSREYTSSLDAAMRLVPEGWEFTVGRTHDEKGSASVWLIDRDVTMEAATPALALCAAAPRARALSQATPTAPEE